MIEIDNTIERLRPGQITELARRTFEVLPGAATSAPVLAAELDALAALTDPTKSQQALLTALAAWVAQNRDSLKAAYPGPTPPFDHLQGFWSNFYEGPRNGDPFPSGPYPSLPTRLLDFELDFPFGVPACALTPHPDYIGYFARKGFDLLTFKTVRDRPWNPHPFPQWAFAPEVRSPIDAEQVNNPVIPTLDQGTLSDVRSASLINSFGVPSLTSDLWKNDVELSKHDLGQGQVLIVSVMGSPEEAVDDAELVGQFASAAADAQDAGADVIEINLSCPNTGGELICGNADLSRQVVEAVRRETRSQTPIFIKISYLDRSGLATLIEACQRGINGIVAINAVSVSALNEAGQAFFPNRPNDKAGLSGIGIRELGLKAARNLVELRAEHRADGGDWVIIGVGGVASAEDFQCYRDLGVDAVQSCSGAWLNHRLALDIRERFGQPPVHRRSWRGIARATVDGYRTGGVSLVTRPIARESER